MLSKEKIREIIKSEIETLENPGEKSGGSGHLGCVEYTIDTIEDPVKDGTNWKIKYEYKTFVTTEFTIYPDNPPYEYNKRGEVILNKEGKIIR